MTGLGKLLRVLAAITALGCLASPGAAQPATQSDKLDTLFAELAQPDRADWRRIEGDIVRLWSRSGSDAMDLLLERGNAALAAQDYDLALELFSALTDHAPDFAEGWNGRATTFYLLGEYALSIADVERVLALEPRHFGALAGLALMFEEMDETKLALRALQALQAINPNRDTINETILRLERTTGAADI